MIKSDRVLDVKANTAVNARRTVFRNKSILRDMNMIVIDEVL